MKSSKQSESCKVTVKQCKNKIPNTYTNAGI